MNEDEIRERLAVLEASVENLAAALAKNHYRVNGLEQSIDKNFEQDRGTIDRLNKLVKSTDKKSNVTIGGFVGALLSCLIVVQLVLAGETKMLSNLVIPLLGVPAATAATGAFAKNEEDQRND